MLPYGITGLQWVKEIIIIVSFYITWTYTGIFISISRVQENATRKDKEVFLICLGQSQVDEKLT